MDVVHTSLACEAHQILFSSLPCGKAMPWSERRVFEAYRDVCTAMLCPSILNSQVTLTCIKNSQRQNCQPNSDSYYTMFSYKFWQQFSRCTRIEWNLCTKITILYPPAKVAPSVQVMFDVDLPIPRAGPSSLARWEGRRWSWSEDFFCDSRKRAPAPLEDWRYVLERDGP